jgi:acyl carrier protein
MRESLINAVKAVLGNMLGVQDRVADMDASTPLFGALPELDSLAVVELAAALEDRFDIVIDDTNFSGEMFASLGSVTESVRSKPPGAA